MRKAKTAKRLSSLMVVFALLMSIFPMGASAVSADKFTDVSRDSWYYDYVDYVADKGYFRGTSDTTFSPNGTMTRAMFVVVLSRMDGARVDNSTSAFNDVPAGSWCAGAVKWAEEHDIVNGIGNGLFAPDREITREQMCAIMNRFIEYYGAKNKLTPEKNGSTAAFPDQAQITAYAREAVANCRAYGLVAGYTDGCFHPRDNSTRAQVAAVIYRLAWLTTEKPSGGGGGSGGSGGGSGSTKSSYTITYQMNDGTDDVFTTGSTEKVSSSSKSFIVTASEPTRDGYTFERWNTAANGTGKSYTAGISYNITANLTLYAIWKEKEEPVDPDDLVGNAVRDTVESVNGRYAKLKQLVISAVDEVNESGSYLTDNELAAVKSAIQDMVTVQTVTYDQSDVGPRTVEASVSVNVTEEQAISALKAATDFASDLLSGVQDGTVRTPSMDKVSGFLAEVKKVVKDKTGIDLDSGLSQIKTDVIAKLMAEGKEEWANFYDAGGYYCGYIEMKASDYTVYIKVDPETGASLNGDSTAGKGSTVSKADVVKRMGEAIAKDMFAQAKMQSNGEYIDAPSMTGTVTVTFAPSATEDYANKQFENGNASTPIYPNVYNVSLTVNLDSDGLVAYKWENDENYLKVTITEGIQKAYNGAIDEVAAKYAKDPEVETKVVTEIKKVLPDKVNALVTEVNTQLDGYGVELTDEDAKALKDALDGVVAEWVDTNWTALVSSLTTGTLTTYNTALIDAAWPVIENRIPAGDDLDEVIQDQIKEQLAENQIDEDWIIEQAMNSSVMDIVQNFVKDGNNVTFEPAEFSPELTCIDDVNKLMSYEKVVVYYNGFSMNVSSGSADETFGDAVRNYIVGAASEKLDEALKSSNTLSQLLTDVPAAKDYLLYSALVQMGLDFKSEQTEAAAGGETLKALRESIVTIAKDKVTKKLDEQIAGIDVSEYLKDASKELQAYQDKIGLLKSLKFSDSDGIQVQTFAGLADTLTGDTLKEIVGDKGNAFVKQYLAVYVGKLMNNLPESASITINSVKFNKDDLAGLSKANTTKEALEAVAGVLDKLDPNAELSINSFDTDDGVPVEITYGGRNFGFNLVIEVAELTTTAE